MTNLTCSFLASTDPADRSGVATFSGAGETCQLRLASFEEFESLRRLMEAMAGAAVHRATQMLSARVGQLMHEALIASAPGSVR